MNSSDALSSFDSDASRVNFWKDINTKDDEYADGAVFMRGTTVNETPTVTTQKQKDLLKLRKET
jgi:hypothetical protein